MQMCHVPAGVAAKGSGRRNVHRLLIKHMRKDWQARSDIPVRIKQHAEITGGFNDYGFHLPEVFYIKLAQFAEKFIF